MQSKDYWHCESITHPEFALIIESIKQFDNVLVVTGGQDVNLHHVVLQLLLGLCVNNFGRSENAGLFVLGLEDESVIRQVYGQRSHLTHPATSHLLSISENVYLFFHVIFKSHWWTAWFMLDLTKKILTCDHSQDVWTTNKTQSVSQRRHETVSG